jgi:putative FmdB family regulatory protein
MPRYEYRCPKCTAVTTLRRPIDEMDDPAECLSDGAPLARQFSPNANILIPISFRQVLTGGAEGGGGLSWSDFHDVSERELARMPNVEKANRVLSQPRNGAPAIPKGISMGEALKEAKERIHA